MFKMRVKMRARKWLKQVYATIGMVVIIASTVVDASTNNVSISITPQAPPGISSGIMTLLSYIDWGVLVGAVAALLIGILHLTGIMGESSSAKKYLGGGILALIIWAGLLAFINGFI